MNGLKASSILLLVSALVLLLVPRASSRAESGETRALYLPIAHGPRLFDLPPRPHAAQVTLDSDRQSAALVSPAGGTVTAIAADGSRFTLIIPADALLFDTTITLTPLQSASGIEGATMSAGVQLAPEGLRFYRPAILRVEPGSLPSPTSRALTGYSGNGRELRMQPLAPGAQMEALVSHFSGVILWEGSPIPNELQPPENLPSEPTARLEHYLGYLTQQLQAGLIDNEQFRERMVSAMREYYFYYLQERLAAAEGSCAIAEEVVPTALSFTRTAELFGLTEDAADLAIEKAAIDESIWRAVENCWEEATTPCLNRNYEPHVARVNLAARQAQIMGGDPAQFNPDSVPDCTCAGVTSYASWSGTVSVTFSGGYDHTTPGGVRSAGNTTRVGQSNLTLPQHSGNNPLIYQALPQHFSGSGSFTERHESWWPEGDSAGWTTISGAGPLGQSTALMVLEPARCLYSLDIRLYLPASLADEYGSYPDEVLVGGIVARDQPIPPSFQLGGATLSLPLDDDPLAEYLFWTEETDTLGGILLHEPQTRATVRWTLAPAPGE